MNHGIIGLGFCVHLALQNFPFTEAIQLDFKTTFFHHDSPARMFDFSSKGPQRDELLRTQFDWEESQVSHVSILEQAYWGGAQILMGLCWRLEIDTKLDNSSREADSVLLT